MKPSIITKLLLLLLCGGAFGAHITADHEKWNRLGRDAFFSYQSHRFDKYMSHPAHAISWVIGNALLLVGFGMLYELAGFTADWLFSSRNRSAEKTRQASVS